MNARKSFATILLCLSITLPAAAQTATAELSGTVTDPTGASVPNAKVAIANAQTGVSREAITNQNGNYLFTILQPGTYNLSAEAQGFRKTVQNNIELQVNQRAEVNLQLQVGQVTDTLEVTGTAPLLEAESSTLLRAAIMRR
jgi:hypothetical protein